MNVQPKLPHDPDRTMAFARRLPGGPRAFATWHAADAEEESWPVELEVGPWRP